jgi:hypothetical protein
MISQSAASLVAAGALVLMGCIQLLLGWRYAEAAKQESTAVGVITYIVGDRWGDTYDYAFEIDGVKLQQDSGVCRTALSPQGCKVGASVLVYYAHLPVLRTRLQEFGSASREKSFFGVCWIACGLLFFGMQFLSKRGVKESKESDETLRSDELGEFQIAPGE